MRFNLKNRPPWRSSTWHTKYEQRSLRWFEGFEAELRKALELEEAMSKWEVQRIKEILGE